MRKITIIAALVMLGLLAGQSHSQQKANKVSEFMKLKLQHAQKVLEGLVMEDFDTIEKNSQSLSLLSQAETWQVLQTPDYLQHSGEFRRAANAVTNAARDKNIDGAALAYLEMTMKCVNCHKYVRDVRMANAGPALDAPQLGK
jgi:cytochrome c556